MWVGALTALVILIALFSQGVCYFSAHTHDGLPFHHCGICHAAHLTFVGPAALVPLAAPDSTVWLVINEAAQNERGPLGSHQLSRAPPA